MPQAEATVLRHWETERQLRMVALLPLRVAYFARLAPSIPTQGLLSSLAWFNSPQAEV